MNNQKESSDRKAKELTIESWVSIMWSRMDKSISLLSDDDARQLCVQAGYEWSYPKHKTFTQAAKDKYLITGLNTLAVGEVTARKKMKIL